MTTAASAPSSAGPAAGYPYRMKDLCELTGLSRQAIHFYVQQGLLPEGRKTGRNMAYYGEEHLERLQLIRRLQQERFLPLKAIKALLSGQMDELEPAQRELLRGVRAHLHASPMGVVSDPGATTAAAELLAQFDVTPEELARMAELGLVSVVEGPDGETRIPDDAIWWLEVWGRLRGLGFSRELGFTVDDLAAYEEHMSALFQDEARRLVPRLSHLPPARIAHMVERALPLVHEILVRSHGAQVRNFFAAME